MDFGFLANHAEEKSSVKEEISKSNASFNEEKIRLEIFKSVIDANVVIDEEFFPFLQQAFEWVKDGKQPEKESKKSMNTNGAAATA